MAEQEYPQEQLDAALRAVREFPGITSTGVARRVPVILSGGGRGSLPALPRAKALALLAELEKQGKVTRQRGQATVTFRTTEEGTHAE